MNIYRTTNTSGKTKLYLGKNFAEIEYKYKIIYSIHELKSIELVQKDIE